MGTVMDVAVVGSGDLARTLAYRLTGAGYRVAVAGLDGQDVGGLAEATGAQAMPLEEAVESSDVVFVAIPFRRHCELPPEPFTGKIVVDATDYFPDRDGAIGELDDGETTSSELLARHLPTARVVKALNTLNFFALGEVGVLRDDVTPVAIPIAADDLGAKSIVAGLVVDLGFEPVDAGTLADSWRMQPGTPVYGLAADEHSIRRALEAA
jgi:predicted dinucleotide-binding enzyme